MTAAEILSSNWSTLTLESESIPHLLHWDLAYLWVLEREPNERPRHWDSRLTAWKRLLALFLLGELEVRRKRIEYPFLRFTSPFRIDGVDELYYRNRLVGVTSSTVLVRPLPEFRDAEASLLPDMAEQRRSELVYVASLLLDNLTILAAGDGYRDVPITLSTIVKRLCAEWKHPGETPETYETTELPLPLLRAVAFNRQQNEPEFLQVFTSRGTRQHPYIPQCKTCKVQLLQEDGQVTEVDSQAVRLTCQSGHVNDIPLEKFFVWFRNTPERDVVCWTDRMHELPFTNDQNLYRFPPIPQVTSDGEAIRFVWDSAACRDSTRRQLTLRFPNRMVREASFTRDALYRRILIPGGKAAGFKGLPVRWEWRDAWLGQEGISSGSSIRYTGIQIKGIPFSINRSFASLEIAEEPDVGLAVYPKPMHPAWRRYRAVALGPRGRAFRVRAPGEPGKPEFMQETPGWPRHLGIESEDGNDGAIWMLDAPDSEGAAAHTSARVCIGVDFGTSNSVVYFQAKDAQQALSSEENAVSLNQLKELLYWVHPQPDGTPSADWFLPSDAQNQDRYLFPSALWRDPQTGFASVRWSSEQPTPGCIPMHGFKWDEGLQENAQLRRAYLWEILFFALPVILERLGKRDAAPGIDLGFAYPLAFDFPKRKAYQKLLESLRSQLAKDCGLDVETYSINESLASVRAPGDYNPGDLFLVADMGGRTLDVALFTYQSNAPRQTLPDHLHQVGSLNFGGEIFLEAVAQHKSGARTGHEFERQYWRLRDAVVMSGGRELGQDNVVLRLLDRFHPMALEFIRVMLCAFREREPEPKRLIRVLLVGNGWRLREIKAGGRDPMNFITEYYRRQLRDFGVESVELKDSRIAHIANSKHLVACGALNAAKDASIHELKQSEFPSRLPAGVPVVLSTGRLEWHDLAGESGTEITDEAEAKNGSIHFEFDNGPQPGPHWANTLKNAVPNPKYPPEESLRQHIRQAIRDHRLTKSPLALVLETHWRHLQ